jgi:hypothetical protein
LDEKARRRHTTDELRGLVKSVRSGEFEYEERPKKSLDWSSYDEAQAYELADMLYLIRRLVDESVNRLPAEELKERAREASHPLSSRRGEGPPDAELLRSLEQGGSGSRSRLQGEAAPL